MKKILFIYNPVSGKKVIEKELPGIIARLQENGYDVTVRATERSGNVYEWLVGLEDEYDRVLVSGGDGTLHEAIDAMRGKEIPLAFIPTGSTNDFANSLGIHGTLPDKIAMALGDQYIKADVGRLADRTFMYVAAFGTLSNVSYSASQELKNIIGHAAYVVEGIRTFKGIDTIHAKVTVNGDTFEDDYTYGMITNSKYVAGARMNYAKDVVLDDGKFEMILIKKPTNPLEVGIVAFDMIVPHEGEWMVDAVQADEIHFSFDKPVAWDLDGEYGGTYQEVTVQVEKQSVRIVKGTWEDPEIVRIAENLIRSQF